MPLEGDDASRIRHGGGRLCLRHAVLLAEGCAEPEAVTGQRQEAEESSRHDDCFKLFLHFAVFFPRPDQTIPYHLLIGVPYSCSRPST